MEYGFIPISSIVFDHRSRRGRSYEIWQGWRKGRRKGPLIVLEISEEGTGPSRRKGRRKKGGRAYKTVGRTEERKKEEEKDEVAR